MRRTIIRTFTFLILFLSVLSGANAQPFLPFANWNHAGINGIYLQPASIADTRMKFDMTLFGLDINVGNDLYRVGKGLFTSGDIENNFDDYKKPISGIDNYRALVGFDMQLLNFMVTLSPKSALGFHSRFRTMVNIDGIDPDMLTLFDNSLEDFLGSSYSIDNLAFRANAWLDVGFTYAREIIDLGPHYLKGGLTLKLMQPITSGYIYIEHADYRIGGSPSTPIDELIVGDIWIDAKGEMAMPKGFDEFNDFTDIGNMFDDWKFGGLGVGFDIGAVYEYRPNHESYRNADDQTKWNRYEPSKYLFRVGFSVLDIGSMKYETDWTQSIEMQASGDDLPEDDLTDFSALRDAFNIEPGETHYRVALPTAISIQTDWRIKKWLYLGVNPYFALRQNTKNKVGTHYVNSINVTPRIEMAGFGFSLPFTYDQFRAFSVGFGLQLGPLWVGSYNAFSMLFADNIREVNFCMGMKVPIYHKKKG